MPKPDISVQSRLTKALKYLQLARTSRELSYDSIPYVVAAEHLINEVVKLNPKGWLSIEEQLKL